MINVSFVEDGEQFMSDLPSFRLSPGSPFESTYIDYFGPFEIRFGKRQRTKVRGVIFTCLTTRAIHLELVTNLTTDRFLMALRRFISIYGQPKVIRSDNGQNFRVCFKIGKEIWRIKHLQDTQ